MSIIDAAKAAKEKAAQKWELAKAAIPAEYHPYIMGLDQQVKIADPAAALDEEARKEGCYPLYGKVFVDVNVPYVGVDGRLVQFVNAHKTADGGFKPYKITSNVTRLMDLFLEGKLDVKYAVLEVTVDSPIFGTATGISRINIGGDGVDRTNPWENAFTSALGRALALFGFGIIPTGGLASYEEVAANLTDKGEGPEKPTPPTGGGSPKKSTTGDGKATEEKGASNPAGSPAPQTGAPAPAASSAPRTGASASAGNAKPQANNAAGSGKPPEKKNNASGTGNATAGNEARTFKVITKPAIDGQMVKCQVAFKKEVNLKVPKNEETEKLAKGAIVKLENVSYYVASVPSVKGDHVLVPEAYTLAIVLARKNTDCGKYLLGKEVNAAISFVGELSLKDTGYFAVPKSLSDKVA